MKQMGSALLLVLFLPICLGFSIPTKEGYYPAIETYPVEWQAVWQVTEREAYYVPINAELAGAEKISLMHNSLGRLFGFDLAGNWTELNSGAEARHDIPYWAASIAPLEGESLLSLTVRRNSTNFRSIYTAIVYDNAGNVLAEIPQATSDYREWMTFIPDEPLGGASWVEFVYRDTRTPAYVKGIINAGIVAVGVHS